MQLSPFLTVFGLRRLRTAIRLVRFGYDTFTECVATLLYGTRIDKYRSLVMPLVRQ